MKKYIIALDQGTTSSRCILFDREGNICDSAQQEFSQFYPESGWVEQDPIEIWNSQLQVLKMVMSHSRIEQGMVAGIGITNQRETTILWDRETGHPVYPAIVWQCRRTADQIEEWKAAGYGEKIYQKTGLIPDAYFSASKICWILDHVEGARKMAEEGRLLFGTVDTWLIWNLTGGKVYATDYTNASRTMLFNIHSLCWDEELLKLFRIPKGMLPEVKHSSEWYGDTDEAVVGERIPICGVAGDQQAALFGQCCFEKGEVKNTYGTGCFLLMNTGEKPVESKKGLLTTIAAGCKDEPVQYALEGSVFIAGAAVQWIRDEMQLVDCAADTEVLARQVEDTAGVYIVPAFTGIGTPYWDPYARGMVVGISRGCSRAHFVRAVLESIAYQVHDLLAIMEEDLGIPIPALQVDGGASANAFLMQFQADMIGRRVVRPVCLETTALGAAYLAGLAAGFWKSREEISQVWRKDRCFYSGMEEDQRAEKLDGWRCALESVLFWSAKQQEKTENQ